MDTENKDIKKKNTTPKRIIFNQENCAGCAGCELACSSSHFGIAHRSLSAIRLDADFYNHEFNIHVCKQCKSASCMDACKKGAIKIDENTGVKYIDKDLCVNCGLCAKACPFSDEAYPPIKKSSYNGKPVMVKCDLCRDREGGPACVSICFYNALSIKEK